MKQLTRPATNDAQFQLVAEMLLVLAMQKTIMQQRLAFCALLASCGGGGMCDAEDRHQQPVQENEQRTISFF